MMLVVLMHERAPEAPKRLRDCGGIGDLSAAAASADVEIRILPALLSVAEQVLHIYTVKALVHAYSIITG